MQDSRCDWFSFDYVAGYSEWVWARDAHRALLLRDPPARARASMRAFDLEHPLSRAHGTTSFHVAMFMYEIEREAAFDAFDGAAHTTVVCGGAAGFRAILQECTEKKKKWTAAHPIPREMPVPPPPRLCRQRPFVPL
jgi:hypothetical protein